MSEEGKIVHHHHDPGHHHHDQPDQFSPPPPPPQIAPQYGTFEGIPQYSPQPAMGFPQPAPPRGAMDQYYSRGYQAVPGYVVAEGTPVREHREHREHEHRLPCCGLGFGWFLFIIGFFLAGIPWYLGAFFLICCRRSVDQREKPAYICCTIAAVLAIIAVIFGVTASN